MLIPLDESPEGRHVATPPFSPRPKTRRFRKLDRSQHPTTANPHEAHETKNPRRTRTQEPGAAVLPGPHRPLPRRISRGLPPVPAGPDLTADGGPPIVAAGLPQLHQLAPHLPPPPIPGPCPTPKHLDGIDPRRQEPRRDEGLHAQRHAPIFADLPQPLEGAIQVRGFCATGDVIPRCAKQHRAPPAPPFRPAPASRHANRASPCRGRA